MFKYSILLVIFLISGCASLGGGVVDALNPLKDDKGIDVTAQIGKNNDSEKSTVKVESGTTKQNADKITNDTAYNDSVVNQITNNLEPWQMAILVLCAGAALPSFREMYVGAKVVVSDVLGALVVYPVKSVANYFKGDKDGDIK
jgi:hypothetical protein